MRLSTRLFVAVILVVLLCASFAFAQAPVSPTGHWEGVVQIPEHPMVIAVDLSTSVSGSLVGTFAQPEQGVKALPLTTVAVQGRTVRFVVKGNDDGSTFAGVVGEDGKMMTGEVTAGEYVIPFTLTRVGDARVAAVPISPAVGKELEGTWHGTIAADGRQMQVEVRLKNQPDGTSRGEIASPTGTGIAIPIAIVQFGKHVTIEIDAVGASFSGELNAAGTEVRGTWNQSTASLPLTLTRPRH
jgi:hypothetical protein